MHESVLLNESIDALAIKPSGLYVDATLGAGGHTEAILNRLNQDGAVIAFDKDPAAIADNQLRFKSDHRLKCIHGSFAALEQTAIEQGWINRVDGILMDLGVSSMQLDQGERGFSFRLDAPLDMRMDTTQGQSANDWLQSVEEIELADVIWRYGEERFSRRIARAIVRAREQAPIDSTQQLSEIIRSAMPKKTTNKHPATRTFQAIRIMINREILDLESVLPQCALVLAPGGRLVVISFHSLEDRVVKRFLKPRPRPPRSFYADLSVQTEELPSMDYIARVVPSKAEIAKNPRARSAIMRIGEKRL